MKEKKISGKNYTSLFNNLIRRKIHDKRQNFSLPRETLLLDNIKLK